MSRISADYDTLIRQAEHSRMTKQIILDFFISTRANESLLVHLNVWAALWLDLKLVYSWLQQLFYSLYIQ